MAVEGSVPVNGVIVPHLVVRDAAEALAFYEKAFGATVLFYLTIAGLIVPSILISLGIGLMFNVIRLASVDVAGCCAGRGGDRVPRAASGASA